jgi:iron complex transport system substrate-binding protein
MNLNEISGDIIDAAVSIHGKLGPGLLESAYELVLVAELRRRGHKVESQVPVSFEYDGIKIDNAFRIDVLVDDQVVVELKSTETFSPVHAKQLKTYLVLTNRKLGLLLNFGMEFMKTGIKRVLNRNSQRVGHSHAGQHG